MYIKGGEIMKNTRLKELRNQHKLLQKDLAELLEVNRTTYVGYENGTITPPLQKLNVLAKYYNVSLDYLVGDSKEYWQSYDSEISSSKIKALAKEVQAYEAGTTQINVYGTIPAGIPIQAIQDIDDTIQIPTQWLNGGNEFIALRVKGDSMYPRYEDGDIVVIQLQPDCENGEDCACYVNGDDVTLKRVYKSDGAITLQPLNSAYRPMTFKHPGEVVILGKVVEQRRSSKY